MRTPGAVVEEFGALDKITAEAIFAAGLASPAEADAVIDDVLRLAEDWRSGRVPLDEVRRLSSPQERFLAARVVRPQPPHLAALFDALIDDDRTDPEADQYRTKHGIFSLAELRWAGAQVTRADGRLRILFPVRHPWAVRPETDEKGRVTRDGERGVPVMAALTYEERFAQANAVERAPAAGRVGRRWRE